MRTMENIEQLLARIVAEDARKHDVIADTRSMSIVTPEQGDEDRRVKLLLDVQGVLSEYALTDHALGQVATDLGVPKRYFDRMRDDAPDLFKTNLHHWMYQEPKARMVRGLTNEDGPMTGRAW